MSSDSTSDIGQEVSTVSATPAAAAVPGGPGPDDSIATLIKQVTEESSRLVRTELRLAQVEMTQKAKTAGVGLGAFGAAGVLALFGIGCLIITAIFALALVLPTWAAALIVGVVVLAVAGVASIALGLGWLTTDGTARRRWQRLAFMCDVSDTLAGIGHLRRRDLPRAQALATTALTCGYALVGGLRLASDMSPHR